MKYFMAAKATRRQRRFEFDISVWENPDVSRALWALFHMKCAFCESPLESSSGSGVMHFRPTSNARDPFRESVDAEHYWWLAYQWKNLYAACVLCRQNLGTQFPIRAARADSSEAVDAAALRRERPLLLDPCWDEPAKHLVFDPHSGFVAPRRGRDPRTNRAAATIQLLGLNREELVRGRIDAAQRAKVGIAGAMRFWTSIYLPVELPADRAELAGNELRHVFSEGQPHLAVRRAMALEIFREHDVNLHLVVQDMRRAGLDTRWLGPQVQQEPMRIAEPVEPAYVSLSNTFVTRVEISNFRAISDLDLSLQHPHPEPASRKRSTGEEGEKHWTVLLGENGAGKSSIVQAICLALAGSAHGRAWVAQPSEFLRRPQAGELAPESGFVRVYLSTESSPREFTFTSTFADWKGPDESGGIFIRAYGSTRLLPPRRSWKNSEQDTVRIANLFDPFTPLFNADRWLAKLGRYQFDVVAKALKDLLQIPDKDGLITRNKSEILVPQPGGAVPLRQLSDGYQTVIALAVDIMAGLPDDETDYRTTPGIVLLDELGTHLHPRWRMEIVGSLRRAFASMQFIATTHEPLCLRGVRGGEVVVMRRDGATIIAVTDLPSPERLRVEQLLTSPFFGLHTTIDPDVERDFQIYYDLLVKPDLTPEEEATRAELKQRLSVHGMLGYTRRDQLLYDVVDRYLAEARKTGTTLHELPDPAKQEIADIWQRVRVFRREAR